MLTFKWLFSLYGASLFCSKQLIIIMANYCFFAVAHVDFVVKKANSTDLFEFVSHDMICLNLYWKFLQSVLNYWCSNNDLWMQMFECIFLLLVCVFASWISLFYRFYHFLNKHYFLFTSFSKHIHHFGQKRARWRNTDRFFPYIQYHANIIKISNNGNLKSIRRYVWIFLVTCSSFVVMQPLKGVNKI